MSDDPHGERDRDPEVMYRRLRAAWRGPQAEVCPEGVGGLGARGRCGTLQTHGHTHSGTRPRGKYISTADTKIDWHALLTQ